MLQITFPLVKYKKKMKSLEFIFSRKLKIYIEKPMPNERNDHCANRIYAACRIV